MNAEAPSARSTRVNAALIALGVLSLGGYVYGAYQQFVGDITPFEVSALALALPYFAASWLIIRAPAARSTWWIGLVFAALFRLVAINTPVYISSDLNRYIWDGRMQAHGINPYRYVPANPAVAKYRDPVIYPAINRKDYAKTIYPPAAQAIFLAATRMGETPLAIRLAMVALEALTIWALVRLLAAVGLPTQRALLYAWHPLVCWEFASGGHIDAAMIAFIFLALLAHRRGREILTAVALAGATLIKFYPVILFPALYRRWRWSWMFPATLLGACVLAYLPYWLTYNVRGTLGFLSGYSSEEGVTTGERFYLLNLVASNLSADTKVSEHPAFVAFVLIMFAAAGAWAFWGPERDDKSVIRRCLALSALFVVVFSPGYAWYFCWLVPFLCVLPYPWLFWMTASAFLLYSNWLHPSMADAKLINHGIYLPAALLGVWQLGALYVHRRRSTAITL